MGKRDGDSLSPMTEVTGEFTVVSTKSLVRH